jgi:hypothetical protein
VLPEKSAFPLYTAVMESVPTGRLLVAKVATPPLSVTGPRVALPFLNVTLPAGVPLYSGTTVAVNVTDCPEVEGFVDEVRLTEVGAAFTT